MPASDPLTARHGTLITEAWRIIDSARSAARSGFTPQGYLARLRQIRRRVVDAHQAELLRFGHDTVEIDTWFFDIETTLAKAEAYFENHNSVLLDKTFGGVSTVPNTLPDHVHRALCMPNEPRSGATQ